MDRNNKHDRVVQRRARGRDGGTDAGKTTLTQALSNHADAAQPAAPEHRWLAPTAFVDAATAEAHGLVQFDPSASPDRDDPDRVHGLAASGISGPSGELPHLDAIQRSFGHHDVGGVAAHVGGPATGAAIAMNAEAYASGDHVAFARQPDLHLAAHEAAHVVQQRGGVRLSEGIGTCGDPFERHADQVADRVVRGESAETLLDQYAHRGPAGGPAVQMHGEGNLRNQSSQALVSRARELDSQLTGGSMPEPQRRETARTLIEIYDILQERVNNGEFHPGAGSNSPLAGLLDDLTPFGNRDQWIALSQQQPRARRAAPRPRPNAAQRPAGDQQRGGGGGGGGEDEGEGGGGDESIGTLGTPRVRAGNAMDNSTAENLDTAGQVTDVVDSAVSIGALAAEFAELAAVSFAADLGGIAIHIASYVLAIAQAHEENIQQARLGGLRIATIGLDVVARGGEYRRNTVGGRQLFLAGRNNAGQEIWQNNIIHALELPDHAVEHEMVTVANALAGRITQDMQRRVAELTQQATARHIPRSVIDREMPRQRSQYLMRVHAQLVPQVARQTEAATRPR